MNTADFTIAALGNEALEYVLNRCDTEELKERVRTWVDNQVARLPREQLAASVKEHPAMAFVDNDKGAFVKPGAVFGLWVNEDDFVPDPTNHDKWAVLSLSYDENGRIDGLYDIEIYDRNKSH